MQRDVRCLQSEAFCHGTQIGVHAAERWYAHRARTEKILNGLGHGLQSGLPHGVPIADSFGCTDSHGGGVAASALPRRASCEPRCYRRQICPGVGARSRCVGNEVRKIID